MIRQYTRWRQLWDRAYAAVTPSGWPARVAWTLGCHGNVRVEEQTVAVRAPRAATVRVAFASDFHAGPATPWPLLESAAARLQEVRPDLLLLGGDFVSLDAGEMLRLSPLLAAIQAPLGKFAVLGNHDHWAGASTVAARLVDAGVEMLTNRAVTLPPPLDWISLCGLDDHVSGRPDAHRAFADARGARLVLMHQPSSLLDIGGRRFDVAFCGHTHGGQIALPNGRPLIVASGALSRRYNAGRYELADDRTLLVSRGVGCGTLPLRWNSPSTVLLCSLVGRADNPPKRPPT